MARKTEQSRKLQKRAEQFIPGGVNSPVRAFRSVGSEPPFILRGEGSHIWDADGNEYVDYIGSWGPLILGHAAPAVVEAMRERGIDISHGDEPAEKISTFGPPSERAKPAAICERPALCTQRNRIRWRSSGAITPSTPQCSLTWATSRGPACWEVERGYRSRIRT